MENRKLSAADLAYLGIMQSLESISEELKTGGLRDSRKDQIKSGIMEVEAIFKSKV